MKNNARYQVATDYKKNVDANKATFKPISTKDNDFSVVKYYAYNGDSPQAIDLRPVNEFIWAHDDLLNWISNHVLKIFLQG